MQKRWVLIPKSNQEQSGRLQKELNIHPVLSQLLTNRKINDFEQAKNFFRPSIDSLHDPFLMKDMDLAIDRIEQAMRDKEQILIYGDYDVDGTTAVALVYDFFHQYHKQIGYYLPDRYAEGYGISTQGIDYAEANGFSLIIALDCGIKSVEKIAYASTKGIDFIIADHHLPGEQLPAAVAILDPKRGDCPYPFKELSGCGIGFKMVQAFLMKNNMDPTLGHTYLDLVAVSIASDIVPIVGENRVLTHFGLNKLNSKPRIGLQSLIDLSGNKDRKFTVNDIVFQISPRINAAGRIDHARDAVRLLLSKTIQEASAFSSGIDIQNTQRKDFDFRITEEALSMIESDSNLKNYRSTVVYKPDWHKGVIGIVASRLIEKHFKPTVVLTQSNGRATGSARSVPGFDLYAALDACSDLLEQFGGHMYAAGLTMKSEHIDLFRERFEAVVAASIKPEMMTQRIQIEAEMKLAEIDAKFFRLLKQFEPSGPENPAPVFMSKNVQVCTYADVVGGKHLKVSVTQTGSPSFDCIGFGLGQFAESINSEKTFDICYTINENIWREKRNLQLVLKDVLV